MRFVVQKTLDAPGYRMDVDTDESEWVTGGVYGGVITEGGAVVTNSRQELLKAISAALDDSESEEE